jgi:hypothetical protein
MAVDQLWPQIALSEYGVKSAKEDPIELNLLFNEWEAGIARRYLREKFEL